MGRRSFGLTGRRNAFKSFLLLGLAVLLGFMFATGAGAFTLTVTGSDGTPVTSYRWLLEEDNTNLTVPGANVSDSISNSIHNSYAPVALRGTATTSSVAVDIPASMADKRFYVSVLPTEGYGMAATTVSVGQETVNLVVEAVPWPTAQISVYAFVDQNLINDGPDDTEQGLGGAGIFLYDYAGQVFYDAFGNPLGTSYLLNADNTVQLDQSGAPVVDVIGNGVITTLTRYDYDRASDPTHPDYNPKANPWNLNVGEALVKYLVPGKYGIRVIPPEADDAGETMTWTQTTTIEGTPTIDAWIKANEPKVFVEGFGAGLWHAAFGFVKTGPPSSQYKGQTLNMLPWNIEEPQGTATIEGTLRVNHFSRPPNLQGYFPGEPVKDAWVALNDPTVQPAIDPGGLFATACDPSTGKFKIEHVPAGTYTLVNWDEPLDMLFGFRTVTVQEGEHLDLGDVLVFQWFGHISGQVFYDTNQNGFPDSTENGVQEQALTLRYRDGTIYQGTTTDNNGYYSFSEVFPFFKWLVLEVDFARLKATGMTSVADYGGEVFPDEGWDWPSRDVLYPQPQSVGHPPTAEVINPNTGNNLSRTETGVVLTQATQTFLGQYNEVNWGKTDYTEDENGGISGLVYYASTRTSDEPRYDTVEPWEPGIPRVRVNLYQDANKDGVIDDLPSDVDRTPLQWTGTWMPQTYTGIPGPEDTDWNKNGIFDQAVSGIQYPDVDNYPFQWTDKEYEGYTGLPGIEDIDRNGDKRFYWGDALRIGVTDSWDDSKPTGCIQDLPVVHGQTVQECADSFGTWNQVRPGIFDGGYAFDDIDMGTYIVEVVPPISVSGQDMYEVVRSQDKNTDFGVEWVPSTQNASVNNDILINPPVCVGPDYVVPEYLTLFPGVEAPLAGQTLADCNMKQVSVLQSRNAAADFFLKTDVPKSARVVGFVNNDLGAEFNMASPNYGEKLAASWIPIAMRDWTGREFQRMYSDEYGGYNCLLPSSYTNNVPSPSGMSPNMITMVLNDPTLPDGTEDPYYNPLLSVTPWTFQYYPGVTTYTDTPLVPLAAFASSNDVIDTEPPDYTPVIASVLGPESKTGPLLCSNRANGSTITLTSVGDRLVLNPDWDPQVAGSIFKITRHYGFGDVAGSVTLNGAPLTIESWNDQQIRATVGSASTGRIMVTRGDNGLSTEIGVTLNIVNCASTNVVAVPGDFGTIQGAIDATTTGPGALILVAPGAYNENVIMYKPVRLQGSGAGGTLINANPNPYERLQIWHDRIEQPPPAGLGGAEFATFIGGANPFVQNEAPGIFVAGQTAYPGGTALNPDPTITKYFNQGYPFTIQGQAAIDGFKLLGSKAGGGIYTFTGAVGLEVSNNEITGNQGNLGGGIALGLQGIGWNGVNNNNIVIARNKIHRNGGVQGGGGITINDYAADYLIEENIIAGNFSRFNGGGINHGGVCPGENVIRYNKILFNENFFGALLNNAGDGGGIYIGGNAAGGTGTGNVTVNANLIQGNLTGSGSGGGIHVFAANGEDLKDFPLQPADWYKIKIFNNMIVNNVAAYKGAGIYMQDVLRGYILQNTIINNDSTGTSALAFEAGAANSTPQASGVVTAVNSDALQLILATSGPTEPDYSNPVLVNNIIWHNRSGYNNASLNNGAGGLAANPNGLFWDVYVPPGENNTRHLNPVRCFLSQQVDPNTGYDYGTNNFYVDPLVVDSYVNTLESTTIVDEGGNNISVRYSPLMPAQGNYHIQAGSPARDNGRSVVSYGFTPLQWDFDGQTRNTVMPDVGADEYQ
ncbi:MAG: hypothetical protein K9N10_10150 [Deltaproteobacteria bacterium]|nr:hypothetical protein [Deltaproteobacteria bacterium]